MGFLAFLAVCGTADAAVTSSVYSQAERVAQVGQDRVSPEPKETAERTARVRDSVFHSRFEQDTGGSAAARTRKPSSSKTDGERAPAGAHEKMTAWKEQYPDVIGYIQISGTNVDYPVVQASSNLYYEHLDIDKNYSKNGVIWADQDVVPSSKNTIVYGHNWTNYSSNPRIGNPNDIMFAQLTAYQHMSFAQDHPTIQYANANGDGTWVIFGAFYTRDLDFYIDPDLSPVFLASKAKQSNLYHIDVDVKETDQVLTLSTCTRYFGNFPNQRFLVMARKLREGEKLSAAKDKPSNVPIKNKESNEGEQ